MLNVKKVLLIKKQYFIEKKTINTIAQLHNCSWDTVKKIIQLPDHKIELRGKRNKSKLVLTSEVITRIHEYIDLEIKNKVSKKQRYTAKVIFNKLIEEGIYKGSSKTIRTAVLNIRREKNITVAKSYLELEFEFGEYLQVDHGECDILLSGRRLTGYLFVATTPGVPIRFCQFYPTKASVAWGVFHEELFKYFGGRINNVIYDNDSVLKDNRTNTETKFSLELQNHYQFKAVYCNRASGNEKGAVENAVGFCRRNYLPGLKEFSSFTEVNNYLFQSCKKEINSNRDINGKKLTDYFLQLNSTLSSIGESRQWGHWEKLKCSSFQQINFDKHFYSLPEKLIDATVKVFITVNELNIYFNGKLVVTHERKFLEGEDSIILDHYLDQLEKKPRAIGHAKVLKRHKFDQTLLSFWNELKLKHQEKEGNVQFIKTLKLRRIASEVDFKTAVELAKGYNAFSYDGVKVILEQLQISQVRSTDINISLLREDQFNLDKYTIYEEVLNDRKNFN